MTVLHALAELVARLCCYSVIINSELSAYFVRAHDVTKRRESETAHTQLRSQSADCCALKSGMLAMGRPKWRSIVALLQKCASFETLIVRAHIFKKRTHTDVFLSRACQCKHRAEAKQDLKCREALSLDAQLIVALSQRARTYHSTSSATVARYSKGRLSDGVAHS